MPEGSLAQFIAPLEQRRPCAFHNLCLESGHHPACQRTRILVAPQRHAAQRPLILGAVIQTLKMAAVFHQQTPPLRVVHFLRLAAQAADFVVQRGGHLPAHETRRFAQGSQPGGEARLKRLHPFFGGVQHDVEGFNDEGADGTHQRSASVIGASTNTSPSSVSASEARANVTHSRMSMS